MAELSGGYTGRGVVESWRIIWMAGQCKPDSLERRSSRAIYSPRVLRLFESLGEQDKRAEAMGDLALCYWRLGAQDDGRALFRQAVEAAQKPETKLRLSLTRRQSRFLRVVMRTLLPCSMPPLLFLRKFPMMGFMAVTTGNVDLYTEDLAGQRIWTMP